MSLVVCDGCARHVRSGTGSCPFCGGTSFAVTPARPRGRVERSALVVGAAGVLVVSSACGARTDIGAPEEEAGCTPYDAGLNVATYGLPPSPPDGSCR